MTTATSRSARRKASTRTLARRRIALEEGKRWVTLDSGAKVQIDGEGTITAGFGKGENIRAMGKREAKDNKGPAARKAAAKKANKASVAAAKKKAKAKGDSGDSAKKAEPKDTGAKTKAAKAAASLTDDDFGDLMSDLEYDTDLTSKGVTADNEAQLKRQFRDQMADIASDYTDSDDDATNKQFADQAADALVEKARQKYGGQGAKKLSADARDEADGWFEDAADPDMQANFDSLRKGDDKAVRDEVRAHMTDMGLEGGDADAAADHVVSNLKSKLKSGEADEHYPASGPAKKAKKLSADARDEADGWFEDAADPDMQANFDSLRKGDDKAVRDEVRAHMTDMGLEGGDADAAADHVVSNLKSKLKSGEADEHYPGSGPAKKPAKSKVDTEKTRSIQGSVQQLDMFHEDVGLEGADLDDAINMSKEEFYEQNRDFAENVYGQSPTGEGAAYDNPEQFKKDVDSVLDSAWSQHQKGAQKAKTGSSQAKAAIDNTATGIAKGVAGSLDARGGKELAAMSYDQFKDEMGGPQLWGEFDDGLEADLGRSMSGSEREQAKEAIVKATYDEVRKKHGKQKAKPAAAKKPAAKKTKSAGGTTQGVAKKAAQSKAFKSHADAIADLEDYGMEPADIDDVASMSRDEFKKEWGPEWYGEAADGIEAEVGSFDDSGDDQARSRVMDSLGDAVYDRIQRKYGKSRESKARIAKLIVEAFLIERALIAEEALRRRAGTAVEHCAVARRALEIASSPKQSRPEQDPVDTDKKLIRGVKILGIESKNTARVIGLDRNEFGDAVDEPYGYTLKACRTAIPLYENAKVFSNHSKFDFDDHGRRVITDTERENEDLLGWLSNVRVIETGDPEKDGLYGDLNYLEQHPLVPRLIEAARRNPSVYALSHEAGFDEPKIIDGRVKLTKITEVDSVALVSSPPGTTKGLFESTPNHLESNSMSLTLKQLAESLHDANPHKAMLKEMITDDEGYLNEAADAPVDLPSDRELAPEEQIRRGMRAAVDVALDKADVGLLKNVLKALGITDSVAEAAAGEADEEIDVIEDEGEPEPDEEEVVAEEEGDVPGEEEEIVAEEEATEEDDEIVAESSRRRRLRRRASRVLIECVSLLNEHQVKPTGTVLEAMASLSTAEKRKAYALELAEAAEKPDIPSSMRTPRSAGPKAKVVETEAKDKYTKHGSIAESIQAPA